VLLLNYPGNPTGAVPSRSALDAIAAVVRRHNLVVVSDEIYDRLSYDAPHVPFATLPGMLERTLLLNGFSKTYGMTGWRVGYAAGPRPLIAAMTRIHQYTALCASRQARRRRSRRYGCPTARWRPWSTTTRYGGRRSSPG
jgi:aminotransferase